MDKETYRHTDIAYRHASRNILLSSSFKSLTD